MCLIVLNCPNFQLQQCLGNLLDYNLSCLPKDSLNVVCMHINQGCGIMKYFGSLSNCSLLFYVVSYPISVATLLLEEWEDDTHTPEMGTWESTGTPKTSEFDCRGQNTLH